MVTHVPNYVLVFDSLGTSTWHALLNKKRQDVTRCVIMLRYSHRRFQLFPSLRYQLLDCGSHPACGLEELEVGVAWKPSNGQKAIKKCEDLAHLVWPKYRVMCVEKAIFFCSFHWSAISIKFSVFQVGEICSQQRAPHDVQGQSAECLSAVNDSGCTSAGLDGTVKEEGKLGGSFLENGLELSQAFKGEACAEYLAVGTVFATFEGGKPVLAESPYHTHHDIRPFEEFVVGLEDLAMGFEAVDEDDLCIRKTEVSDEGSLGILSRQFDREGHWRVGVDLVEGLTQKPMIVFGAGELAKRREESVVEEKAIELQR